MDDILVDDQPYQWRNGQVSKLTDKNTIVEVLGTAKTESEAILLLPGYFTGIVVSALR